MLGSDDVVASPTRILIADDHRTFAELFALGLEREPDLEAVGHARTAAEALQMADSLRPDLVIMDVKMPVRDGIDAAAEIANKRLAAVVMLTAFSQREFVEKARDAGAMAYLVKPFTKADLVPTIEVAVSRYTELHVLEADVADLTERLEIRKLVERAKGILMQSHSFTEPEAFKWIQRTAMDHRMTMKEVAERILAEQAAGGETTKSSGTA